MNFEGGWWKNTCDFGMIVDRRRNGSNEMESLATVGADVQDILDKAKKEINREM